MQSWIFLYVAIALEVAGTIALKFSKGMTVVLPSALSFILYMASLSSLSFALRQIPVSVAYAIWAGLGSTAVAVIGIFYFKEPTSMFKILSMVMVVIGLVGLNLSGAARH
jgi:small multidrug resistance pump